jgi:hypothetical protein
VQRALSSMVILGWRRDGKPARILPELAPVQAAPEPGRSCCAGGSP